MFGSTEATGKRVDLMARLDRLQDEQTKQRLHQPLGLYLQSPDHRAHSFHLGCAPLVGPPGLPNALQPLGRGGPGQAPQ
jgi:hypothetical protein